MTEIQSDKEALIAARKLIEKPENWTQCAYAHSFDNHRVSNLSNEAFSFCSIGALGKVNNLNTDIIASINIPGYATLCKIAKTNYKTNIITFNDTRSHSEILKLFDEAIESCE